MASVHSQEVQPSDRWTMVCVHQDLAQNVRSQSSSDIQPNGANAAQNPLVRSCTIVDRLHSCRDVCTHAWRQSNTACTLGEHDPQHRRSPYQEVSPISSQGSSRHCCIVAHLPLIHSQNASAHAKACTCKFNLMPSHIRHVSVQLQKDGSDWAGFRGALTLRLLLWAGR